MSENDRDPRPGEYTDPTASPDWTAPSGSSGSHAASDADAAEDRPPAAESAPTEQLPQGSQPPPVPPVPPAPSHDAPHEPPRSPYDPYAGSSAQPTSPYAAPPPPPYDPYAAPQPAYDPYAATGGQAQQGAYPAYGAPEQWQTPPPGYGAPAPQNTSALVLTILSGIVTLSCCIPGIAPLVLGIMALNKQSTDPEGSRRLTRWGWIAFGVGIALVVLGIIGFIALGAAGVWTDGGYSSDSDFSY